MYGYTHDRVFEGTEAILKLCKVLQIDTIAGPATSGVVIAMACFMRSRLWNNPINAMLLEKNGCKRAWHSKGAKFMGNGRYNRVLIVDDCTEYGDTLIHAIGQVVNSEEDLKPVACVTWYFHAPSIKKIRKACPEIRLYKVIENTSFEV
jgi:orotate phosphoribosyltransferase